MDNKQTMFFRNTIVRSLAKDKKKVLRVELEDDVRSSFNLDKVSFH